MNLVFTLLLENILEAVYFSLFLIIGKGLKEKRLLFIIIMIFEYLILKCVIKYNVWFQIIYTFMSFVNLKVLYKDKAQITDIFLFAIASIILILVGLGCGAILFNKSYLYNIMLIINRILIFGFIFIFKNKIFSTYKNMRKYWNRNTEHTKIRSLTLRNISIIIFNLMFCVINTGLIMAVAFMEKR